MFGIGNSIKVYKVLWTLFLKPFGNGKLLSLIYHRFTVFFYSFHFLGGRGLIKWWLTISRYDLCYMTLQLISDWPKQYILFVLNLSIMIILIMYCNITYHMTHLHLAMQIISEKCVIARMLINGNIVQATVCKFKVLRPPEFLKDCQIFKNRCRRIFLSKCF